MIKGNAIDNGVVRECGVKHGAGRPMMGLDCSTDGVVVGATGSRVQSLLVEGGLVPVRKTMSLRVTVTQIYSRDRKVVQWRGVSTIAMTGTRGRGMRMMGGQEWGACLCGCS
jgi:hypothetical protein